MNGIVATMWEGNRWPMTFSLQDTSGNICTQSSYSMFLNVINDNNMPQFLINHQTNLNAILSRWPSKKEGLDVVGSCQ